MARLLVGLSALKGDLETYQGKFDLVEIQPVDGPVPRGQALRKWRKQVAPTFVFSVVLPRVVGELTPGAALDEALRAALEAAAAIEARCVLLRTPPAVRPTNANKKRIAAIFERIPPEGTVRCWEPSGLWEREEVLSTARLANALPVFDAAREPLAAGPIVYTRLRALGASAALSASTLDRVADRLRKRREAFVIVENVRDGARVRSALATLLAERRDRPLGSTVRPAMPSPLVAEDEEQ